MRAVAEGQGGGSAAWRWDGRARGVVGILWFHSPVSIRIWSLPCRYVLLENNAVTLEASNGKTSRDRRRMRPRDPRKGCGENVP